MVDDRAVANERAKPQIALDERRDALERRFRVDLILGQAIHRHAQSAARTAQPFLRGKRIVMQEAQRFGVRVRISAFKTRAADHHIDLMLAHVGPKAMPKQFHRALVAVGREHARAPQFHKAVIGRLGGNQRRYVVFARGVKSEAALGHVLAQHAVSTNHLRQFGTSDGRGFARFIEVDHQQMIADRIVGIFIAAAELGETRRHRAHLFVENLIPQPLRHFDLGAGSCQPHFEISNPAVYFRRHEAFERQQARMSDARWSADDLPLPHHCHSPQNPNPPEGS